MTYAQRALALSLGGGIASFISNVVELRISIGRPFARKDKRLEPHKRLSFLAPRQARFDKTVLHTSYIYYFSWGERFVLIFEYGAGRWYLVDHTMDRFDFHGIWCGLDVDDFC